VKRARRAKAAPPGDAVRPAPEALPPELLRRTPCLRPEWLPLLLRMREHPDAPCWNHVAGDRLERDDLAALDRFREALAARRPARSAGGPTDAILERIESLRTSVPAFRDRLPPPGELRSRWAGIPTMSREDVAVRPQTLVPVSADLGRLIVYRTAGTTGHALLVPHHPRAAASYQPLLEAALRRHGVEPSFGPGRVACLLLGAQRRTVTYPTVLAAWGGAGFAKLNLHPGEWPEPGSPRRYVAAMEPFFLTGDPISFAELMRLDVPVRPAALVSTAVAMSAGLKRRLARRFGCPVIDWYSLTETGPIGYACPRGEGFHVLPHDLFVEAIDAEGRPVPDGQRGEIAVTGGRNPYLPLLRYRTGDWGRLEAARCPCGDPAVRILDLEGRKPVLYRTAQGAIVNPVDLSRALRAFPLVQHAFTQRADLSCELVVRPIPGVPPPAPATLANAVRSLLGGDVSLEVRFDPALGDRTAGGKVEPYRSELLLED